MWALNAAAEEEEEEEEEQSVLFSIIIMSLKQTETEREKQRFGKSMDQNFSLPSSQNLSQSMDIPANHV